MKDLNNQTRVPFLALPFLALGVATLALGGFGLGYVSRQDAAPAAEQVPSDTGVVDARKAIEDAYTARMQSVLGCLPKDATPLAKMQALRPLWDEERQWHIFFEGCLYTEEFRSRWKAIGTPLVEHPAQFVSLDAKFLDVAKSPTRIDVHHLETVLTEMPKVHLLRRELAREILTKVIKTASKDKDSLTELWPVPSTPDKPTLK